VAFLLGAAILPAAAQPLAASEYEVKAAFLFNFAKFVEWPSEAFSGPSQPITICVLGKNPFGSALNEVIAGNTLHGRPFSTRLIADIRENEDCHILFFPASESKSTRPLLEQVRNPCALTVGEAGNFLPGGGMVNFVIQDGRVRFEINPAAVGKSNLRVSSKLLSLATNSRK
jgi:hypothetical protein